MGMDLCSSSPSSSVSSSPEHASGPAKRPVGRTKFRETRHPVYHDVRRRGNAGRWVCEVRVPSKRGARLWLGTYLTAGAAARANDAAMLALGGRSARRLNFADSAWLLAVPFALSDLADVRRTGLQAVANFQRREAASGLITRTVADSADSSETSEPSADGDFELPVAMDSDMFRLDFLPEMDLGSYYVSLAEALLMDPPSTATIIDAHRDNGDGAKVFLFWEKTLYSKDFEAVSNPSLNPEKGNIPSRLHVP
nr:HvCBF13 [Hordeum vulgare subsp. vulgare]ACI62506.1 CBF13 [Hordeum vulgare subsp. vulgare]